MKSIKVRMIVVVLAGMLFAINAATTQAAPVTYYFAGALNEPFGTLPVGTPFCGSFTYNWPQPLNTPWNPFQGNYTYTSFSVTIGSVTVTDNSAGLIHVYNKPGHPTDMFNIFTLGVSGTFGGLPLMSPGDGIQVVLQDLTGTVWNSPALPGPGLSLSNFTVVIPPRSGNATFLELESWDPVEFDVIHARGELTALSSAGTVCQSCLTPPPGMVAWYPFDEPSPVLSAAEFVNWNNGTLVNGPVHVPGQVSNGLRFDGANDYVQSPDQTWLKPGTGDFSIDTWIKVTPPAPSARTIVDKRSGSGTTLRGYNFFVSQGRLGIQLADAIGTGYTNYLSPLLNPPLTNSSWHHVAVTVSRASPTGITFYHNGAAIGTGNPTNRPGSLTNNSPLRIGTQTAGPPFSAWFRGSLDELEIFNRALTTSEVLSIFNAGPLGKCKCK